MKQIFWVIILLPILIGCNSDPVNKKTFTLKKTWKKGEVHKYKMTYRKTIPSQKKRGTVPIDLEMFYTLSYFKPKRGNVLVDLKLDKINNHTSGSLDGEGKLTLASYGLDMLLELEPNGKFMRLENTVQIKKQMIEKMTPHIGKAQAETFNNIDAYEQQRVLESFFLREFDFLFLNYGKTYVLDQQIISDSLVRATPSLPSSRISTTLNTKTKGALFEIKKDINTLVDASSLPRGGANYVTEAATIEAIENATYDTTGIILKGIKSRTSTGGNVTIQFQDGTTKSAPNLKSTETWTIEKI